MKSILLLLSGALIGFLIGRLITIFLNRKKMVGTLRMDHSDPTEEPYLFLEMNPGGMAVINREKIVFFRVDLNEYLPRK